MKNSVYILGINGLGSGFQAHNPSAVLLKNGEIVAMAEEERFVRIKKAIGLFPYMAIKFCLEKAGITINEVKAVGWSADPYKWLQRWRTIGKHPILKTIFYKIASNNRLTKYGVFSVPQPDKAVNVVKMMFERYFGKKDIEIICVDHHLSHCASSYYVSGMNNSTIISWDGGGDGLSCMIAYGEDDNINIIKEFPISQMSIGQLYWSVHLYYNFRDDGSLMGLAGYGNPKGYFDKIIDYDNLKMDFRYLSKQDVDFPINLGKLIGKIRLPTEKINSTHQNVAADVQKVVERFAFKILEEALKETNCKNLSLAGGVALNAVLNGKIRRSGLINEIFIQPNAGDGGCALGAAFIAYKKLGYKIPRQKLEHVYWGSSYTNDEIEEKLNKIRIGYEKLNDDEIIEITAKMLTEQKIIGWFQTAAEWGPRALGARSILADPRSKDMWDRVNKTIKFREEFRPLAPTILDKVAPDYLQDYTYAPFMIMNFIVKKEKRGEIPAVVHIDNSTRPQILKYEVNSLYYKLIERFGKITGTPVILNTSFNLKGEPIVNSPEDALKTFYSTSIDALVIGNFLIKK